MSFKELPWGWGRGGPGKVPEECISSPWRPDATGSLAVEAVQGLGGAASGLLGERDIAIAGAGIEQEGWGAGSQIQAPAPTCRG